MKKSYQTAKIEFLQMPMTDVLLESDGENSLVDDFEDLTIGGFDND